MSASNAKKFTSQGFDRSGFAMRHHILTQVICLFAVISIVQTPADGQEATEDTAAQWCSMAREGAVPVARYVFLGDSNTYAGHYVALIDAKFHALSGDQIQALNLGVASETASGLSEPDHPFKRPCVHSRLDKVLRMLKPSRVIVCYGMNDGIYAPQNDAILETYKSRMLLLAEKTKATGAELIVMTPPPFEADAIRKRGKKFGPNSAGNYAWNAPAEDYDQVLKRMSDWCLKNELGAKIVIDIRTPLLAYKESQPEGTLLTGDGVHFNTAAHTIVAKSFWASMQRAYGISDDLFAFDLSTKQIDTATRRMKILRDAYLSAVGKNRPGLPAGLPLAVALQQVQGLEPAEELEQAPKNKQTEK